MAIVENPPNYHSSTTCLYRCYTYYSVAPYDVGSKTARDIAGSNPTGSCSARSSHSCLWSLGVKSRRKEEEE